MPLYIKDDATTLLVDQLVKLRGVSKQDAAAPPSRPRWPRP
jgi:hypothetical protein